MNRRRRPTRRTPVSLDRSAKRAAQKAAGAFDGRFRPRVVRSRKTYSRRPKHRGEGPEGAA